METENRHNCHVCGGCDFLMENGFFYCTECQTQCEGIREQVFEDQGGGSDDEKLFGTPFIFKKVRRKPKQKPKGEMFTSWEMFNFVLLGLTEELISCGAPESIRDTVLQMWAFYLQKLEIAFFSKDERALPKLGVKYHQTDAENLYGLKKKKVAKRTRLLDASINADLNSTVCDLENWGSQEIKKTIKRKAKKAFMQKVAESTIAENADNESIHSSLDQSSVFDISAVDDFFNVSFMSLQTEDESDIQPKFERSQDALAQTAPVRSMLSPLVLTRSKLLVLLYLSLLYEGSTIQIGDILRWIREGHLSYQEAANHLPENCVVQGMYMNTLKLFDSAPTYAAMLQTSNIMAKYLGVRDWPLPNPSAIAKKYVTELQLPGMFSELVERFVALVPLAYCRGNAIQTKGDFNYEGAILAIIVIILKLLFGLDGRTEHKISKAAFQLNILLKQKNNAGTTKLFVWKDWVQQLLCRRAVLTMYHFPTKQLLCPETYGNPYAYINFCRNWLDKNAGFETKFQKSDDQSLKAHYPALVNILTSVLEKLQDSDSLKRNDIKFPQCDTPYSVYIQKIIEKSAQMDTPLIAKPAVDVLAQDFSECDIKYLLEPKSMMNLASVLGQQLKIKKSAQKKFKKVTVKKVKKVIKLVDFNTCVNIGVTKSSILKKEQMKRDAKENLKMNKKRMKEKEMLKKISIKKKKKKRSEKNKSEKVKKHSRKKEVRETTGNGNAKHLSQLCDSSRKRRKEILPSGSSKKFKLSKLLKLYVPASKYWHHEIDTINAMLDEDFEKLVLFKFPFSFSWLLSECAFLSEMSKVELYREIVRIEGYCHRMFM